MDTRIAGGADRFGIVGVALLFTVSGKNPVKVSLYKLRKNMNLDTTA